MKANLPETLYVYMEDIGVGDDGEDEFSPMAFDNVNDFCGDEDEDTEIGVYELKTIGKLEREVTFVASKKRK